VCYPRSSNASGFVIFRIGIIVSTRSVTMSIAAYVIMDNIENIRENRDGATVSPPITPPASLSVAANTASVTPKTGGPWEAVAPQGSLVGAQLSQARARSRSLSEFAPLAIWGMGPPLSLLFSASPPMRQPEGPSTTGQCEMALGTSYFCLFWPCWVSASSQIVPRSEQKL